MYDTELKKKKTLITKCPQNSSITIFLIIK